MRFSRCAAAAAVIGALLPLPLQAKIQVVASFSILGDIVRNIGQDKIELRTVVGPG